MSNFPKKYTTETLRVAIHKKHPNIDLISEYLGDNDSEITVKCTIHNEEWKTTPHRLSQQKHGCKKCYQEERKRIINEIQTKKFQEFIEKNYKPLYDISQIEYIDNKTKVKLVCPKHGEFNLRPDKMVNRFYGCPYCKESHLEKETKLLLDKLGIEYEREKTFDWLKYKSNMFLDFYLPKYNTAIECQGTQHIDGRNGTIMTKKQSFEERIEMDKLKFKLCNENNISIIYIFNKKNSSKRLDEQFGHMYDDALFIEDVIENNDILIDNIK